MPIWGVLGYAIMNQETKNRVKTVTSVPQIYSAINILYFLLSEGSWSQSQNLFIRKKELI